MKHFLRNAGLFIAIAAIAFIAACNSDGKKTGTADTTKKDTTAIVTPPMAVDSGHLVGVWHDEAIKSDDGKQIAYEVVSSLNTQKIYIQAITFTGTDLKVNDTPPISPSATEIKKDGDHYVSVERPNEIYKVDKKGSLLIYDENKLVAVCGKIL